MNFINNTWIAGEGESFSSFSPERDHEVWQGNEASESQVDAAIAAAQSAFKAWRKRPLPERIAVTTAFAEQLHQNAEHLADVIHQETGKPLWEARTEVQAMINKVDISVAAFHERTGTHSDQNLRLNHRAHGVMAVFGPYNFPGHLPNGHIVPALIAGNTVVFKPSEQTPKVAEETLKIWLSAGLPAGVICLVQGGAQVGAALVNGDVNGVLFTGSSKVGAIIHKALAGRPEVIAALEMGGNNPLIVSDYKDIDFAVNTTINSAFLSAGQRCTCTRRVIVVEDTKTEAFLNGLRKVAKRLVVGATGIHDPEPFMGPVINPDTGKQLLSAQRQLTELGGEILLEMQALDDSGARLSPGIIDMTGARNHIDEEWFGPLLQVIRVKDIEQAIEAANATRYGLAAGLISDSDEVQTRFLADIEAGVTSINAPTAGASSKLPFGGVGASGNHRPGAYYAADYCAWPQAAMIGGDTDSGSANIARGLKA